jgi:hypothetical protein
LAYRGHLPGFDSEVHMTKLTVLTLAFVLMIAACGGDDDNNNTNESVESTGPSAAADDPPADEPPEPDIADDVETSPEDVASPPADADDPPPGEQPGPNGTTLAGGWSAQALGAGAKPVLALDADDSPAVAWLSEAIDEGFVSFASGDDGWTEERIVEGYFYGPIGLDFDPAGLPHVVYHDHQSGTFEQDLGDLALAVRSSGAWSTAPAEDDGHDGWDSTVAIGTDGIVRAAGIDPQQFGRLDGIEYYELGPDGWSVTAIGSGPIEYEWNVSLDVSNNGDVALSYFDNNSADLVFASLAADGWQLETVDSDGDVGRFSSLAVDAGGTPHISYYAGDGTVRYATKSADGWVTETVGRLDAVQISFSGARRITGIDLDSQGVPQIVFGDLEVVRHAIPTPDGWEVADVLTASDTPLGQLVSLAVDDQGSAHIATYTGSADQPASAEILYLLGP